ncbi:unnamed protein product [Symbiodinium natans]|uniref:Uncharacterized protein n=1 Tax=Symbiodinium natans TaxID=878477 RepID=A0A812PBH3_9DINO|nr:unnamed protein product [Symbiodinium natans]
MAHACWPIFAAFKPCKVAYDSECAQYLFPNHQGNHEVSLYALCWWRVSEELAGPFGERNSSVIRFVDPRVADINHVVGARGLSDPALLYHFAGRSKDWEAMLATFGLDTERARTCLEVYSYVDNRWHMCLNAGLNMSRIHRQDAADRYGGVVMDYAYGGGPLRLSEVAQHLDQTFCSIDRCYMGVISAGGGSGPDEQGILYDKLNAASGGKAGDGSWSNWGKGSMNSQKIVFTPDPKKGCAAKQLFDWLNGEKQAGIAPDEVYLFDDRWGNAAEMAEFGFNGREISCTPRDKMIGNGVVGLCGALLREIRREKGIKTCQQLVEEGFYK